MSAAPVVESVGEDAKNLSEKLNEVKLENGTTQSHPAYEAANGSSSSQVSAVAEKPAGPQMTPIPHPLDSVVVPSTPELTVEQQSKYETVLETVKSWKEVPSTKGKEGPVTENEILWLTKECILRYLRATKWSTADAEKRLLTTLTWRREYGVEELTGDHISPESETGKQFIVGWDIAGRPCHYLVPGRQNTEPSPRQVQHLVFMLERVIDIMIPGQETLALLINFKTSKTRTNTAPGLSQGREVLNILQTHYPERLGRALIINIPWIVSGFFKLITPFIDPLTRQKLKFNDDMRQHVPPQQLWNEFHGDMEFEYDHAVYWPALLKFAEERYAERRERWVQAGKHYGESEIYLRGGNVSSVYQSLKNGDAAAPEKETVPTETKETAAEDKEAAPEQKEVVTPVEDASVAEESKAPV
ncbi:CRAL/TRIO domain-containing protein [Stipitochalara longipes BDJ]|nr:CRAL/TRIO domain-containing protein [Stipitochalara longipes BDJ]